MAQKDSLWPKVMGYLLWAISAALGVAALFAAIDLVQTVAVSSLGGCDPMKTVSCSGTARLLMIMSYGLFGIIWIAWNIYNAERYPTSKTAEELSRRFAITTAIQIGIVSLWFIIDRALGTA
jgi:nicotinamide riboside transporter PnuC